MQRNRPSKDGDVILTQTMMKLLCSVVHSFLVQKGDFAVLVDFEQLVGIEILAMKSLQANMSSGPGYYEGELYNIIRNGRGVPAVPLVLVGIEP
jgi:hypothetical protein